MQARILTDVLSDNSEVYRVRVTCPGRSYSEFVLDFDMADYASALAFASAFESADVCDARIFSVSPSLHKGLTPI